METRKKRHPIFKIFTIVLFGTLMTGCELAPVKRLPAPVSSPKPVVESATAIGEPTSSAKTTALQEQETATSPWDFIALSRQVEGIEHYGLILDAIEGFLDLNQSATARSLLEQISTAALPNDYEVRRRILLARSYFVVNEYKRVERVLGPLSSVQGLNKEQVTEILLLRAKALEGLGDSQSALRLHAAREPYLADSNEILQNQSEIWRLLGLLDPDTLEALRSNPGQPTIAQWADLALISQSSGWNPHHLKLQLKQWQQLHPRHPATAHQIPQILTQLGSSITEYRKVALLLPLTSGFGSAARAVYDGFLMMSQADSNPGKPQIALYDTGEDPELIGLYYQAAIREGAEFIVGPLGKSAVDALTTTTELTKPTLLLGNTDQNIGLNHDVFQFSLSPEGEARNIAQKTFAAGHRIAAVLYPKTDWGQRQLDAFTTHWTALGGTIAESAVYEPERADQSQTIKLLLNIDESEARHRSLSRLSEKKLEFAPKRREDLDFIFMIARAQHGRLLKPQINFHNAQNIPVYAISQIFTGKTDSIKDLDLDGIIFSDIPWLLQPSGTNRYIRENLPNGSVYENQALDRLFALGIDAYQLLFRIEPMKTNPQLVFQGATGSLRLRAEGQVSRQMDWAQFLDGKATPINWDTNTSRSLQIGEQ